jgi:hypothetical protein
MISPQSSLDRRPGFFLFSPVIPMNFPLEKGARGFSSLLSGHPNELPLVRD